MEESIAADSCDHFVGPSFNDELAALTTGLTQAPHSELQTALLHLVTTASPKIIQLATEHEVLSRRVRVDMSGRSRHELRNKVEIWVKQHHGHVFVGPSNTKISDPSQPVDHFRIVLHLPSLPDAAKIADRNRFPKNNYLPTHDTLLITRYPAHVFGAPRWILKSVPPSSEILSDLQQRGVAQTILTQDQLFNFEEYARHAIRNPHSTKAFMDIYFKKLESLLA